MKKALFLIILSGMMAESFGQPQINSPTYPNSVGLFDLFEVSFTMGVSYSNPYDPNVISIYGIFTSPNNTTYRVDAFYYEGYSFYKQDGYEHAVPDTTNAGANWRIRFTPTLTGNWTFKIVAKTPNGTTQVPINGAFAFTCNSVVSADGFISKANSRYLKRDIVRKGNRLFHSFFPIGPDIAWYSCQVDTLSPPYSKPYGIYEYKKYIDSLDGNANYMRIFLNRYQYLSLYGPEYTQFDSNGRPIVYFDNTINQKDSAELDYIVSYAAQHGVAITPCIFSCGDFLAKNKHDDSDSSIWAHNPYSQILGRDTLNTRDFFTDARAIRITRNLIRYIVSRWGYATNIMSWELWNEVSNMFRMCDDDTGKLQEEVLTWHNEMSQYIHDIDPFNHCVSTSMGTIDKTFKTSPTNYNYPLDTALFKNMDIVVMHNYLHIQKAKSKEQISKMLYDSTMAAHAVYPSKPFFMEEFGFGQGSGPRYREKDPYGIDLHNSLWSSLFSTSMGPGSFWWWYYLKKCKLFHRFTPLLTFCRHLPILSESFTAYQTGSEIRNMLVFPNNLETYYMINATEDTIYGWSQDTAFAYQSLRWLTDSVHFDTIGYPSYFIDGAVFDTNGYVYKLTLHKRPRPSFNCNTISIPITNQPVGSRYRLTWYNTETGLADITSSVDYAFVQLDGQGDKVVHFNFPSIIRDLSNQTINNTFGDVVFSLILNNKPKNKDAEEKNDNPVNL